MGGIWLASKEEFSSIGMEMSVGNPTTILVYPCKSSPVIGQNMTRDQILTNQKARNIYKGSL
jgi:hypothetical protein